MGHIPTKHTARLAALIAVSMLTALAATAAEAAAPSSHVKRPPGHHRVGPNDWTEQVVYSFQGGSSDGSQPWGDLTQSGGAIYSTTLFGGAAGMGTVFKLAPSRAGLTESVVHSFAGGADGANPWQGMTSDLLGNLYGATGGGGAVNTGTVFKLTSHGE